MDQVFYAYPSNPPEIGIVIQEAVKEINKSGTKVLPWTAMDIIGNFIADEIIESIEEREFVADITRLNFNVVYELGYAIGRGKKVLITKNSGLEDRHPSVLEVGIFDTLGYAEYQNSVDLITILRKGKPHSPYKNQPLNNRSPVYLLESKTKTDFAVRIAARVKKARLTYRSFDPNENPRLSALEAISQVAQSHGVIVTLLNKQEKDNEIHNIRAAFIAGLAAGMNKVRLILQYGMDAVPIDVRDFVNVYNHLGEINAPVGDFAMAVVDSLQQGVEPSKKILSNTLETIDLGASAAENEMRTLQYYYLKTDAYLKAVRGETQLVVGRKGSGKSAIFLQIRDTERNKVDNIVLDLKPDGYKLIKFKEQVLDFLEEGTFQHTIMAFWEYVLLLEICHKALEKDKQRHFTDKDLGKLYNELEKLYLAEDYLTEGDFSERMSGLMENLQKNYEQKYGHGKKVRLSIPQITELLYETDIKKLKDVLTGYLAKKKKVWLLFDNIDKGWPASGLKHEDLIIIRALIDATRKIQRHFERQKIDVLPIIFLRNDVYELLVIESPDRQKEAKVLLDWTDPDLLREIIKLRILSNEEITNAEFDILWRRLCVSHYKGEDSFEFIVERSLMRPRFLLNLINHCRSIAVNLNHSKIQEEDIQKGLTAYSADLLIDIHLEIRDIFPQIENLLMGFIDSNSELSEQDLNGIVEVQVKNQSQTIKAVDLLLWYCFLGIKHDSEVKYIYSTNYSLDILKALIQKKGDSVVYVINPGFYPALMIHN
jgi:hypothetical protein